MERAKFSPQAETQQSGISSDDAALAAEEVTIAKKYEICLRLSKEEKALLESSAWACGLTKTAYLRRLLLGTEVKARPSQEIKALRTEIHHIGNNIVRPDRALCKAEKWYCPAR